MPTATTGEHTSAGPAGLARLHLSLRTAVALDSMPAILGSPQAPWLGKREAEAPLGFRRFACDLALHVGPESRAIFRKAAIVGLGEVRHEGDTYVIPIEWFAANFGPAVSGVS